MSSVKPKTLPRTMEGLLKRLGGIPASRVRLRPLPGSATETDVVQIRNIEKILCELINGTLVEKTMGAEESFLTMDLVVLLGSYVKLHDLGAMMGPDGAVRLMPGLVRIPDISFVSWAKLPDRVYPKDPIPDLIPDLAIEVLSKGNTRREMAQKLRDYFDAGVKLVWFVSPKSRTVSVYTGAGRSLKRTEDQTLEGGDVLPGFVLPLRELFARLNG